MAQWTARICWIFCFGVVSCSLFALKLLTTQFCCMQREGNAPVSTRQGVGFLKCARVLGQTLHTTDTKMGIWEVSYFLICTWSTSLWCPWGCEFPVFFVELLQVLRAYSGSVKEWLQTSEQELQPLLPFLWSLQTHRQSVTSLRVTYKVRADRIQLQAGVKPAIICFAGAAVLGCRAKSFPSAGFWMFPLATFQLLSLGSMRCIDPRCKDLPVSKRSWEYFCGVFAFWCGGAREVFYSFFCGIFGCFLQGELKGEFS